MAAILPEEVRTAAHLRTLFPPAVGIGCVAIGSHHDGLWADEVAAVRFASPKRRTEFVAGRSAARAAMQGLGLPAVALPRLPDGRPDWPAGVVGSISHTDELCAAAVANDAALIDLGLDIEAADPFDQDLIPLVCLPAEIAAIASWRSSTDLAKIIFSAKEAFYKCVYPSLQTFLDFNAVKIDVTCRPCGRAGSFSAQLLSPILEARIAPHVFVGRWMSLQHHVACGAALVRAGLYRSAI